MKVEYKDTSILTEDEKDTLKIITGEYIPKIDLNELIIDFKVVNKGGTRKRFTVNLNSKDYHASAEDWDLAKTLHSVFKKLIREIKHKRKE
jgi:hypothetical protein